MEPASTIINKLGGPQAIARHIGLHPNRVAGWRRPREKGGTGGNVPHWHVPKLLELAREKNVELSALDFAPVPDQPPSESGAA